VTAAAAPLLGSPAHAAPAAHARLDWDRFDRAIRDGFDRMRITGAAVAVVSADRVLHTTTLGSRSLSPRRPVTPLTRFVVASTTKSMAATFVATYVDQGLLGWDQLAVDAWSGFRAPTDELTRSLTVRDLLGMGSGIRNPPPTDLHLGEPTAGDLMQTLVTMPVVGRPRQEFFYTNVPYAAGGYLPLLASGVALKDLGASFAKGMTDRVFRPAGMTGAAIGADPRELVDDYAVGYGSDLRGRPQALAYAAAGSTAPASSGVATLEDMAAWVRLQLRKGLSVTGGRVVSAANLAECWKAGVAAPVTPTFDPDAVSQHYGMGWFREEYRDGSTLIHHSGYVDGFTPFIGFLPAQDIGLIVLTNHDFEFRLFVLNVLLDQLLGLNPGVPDAIVAAGDAALAALASLDRQSRAVDLKPVAPYLGYYERGYSLQREGREVQLRLASRVWPLVQMPDGSYLVSHGILRGNPVRLARAADGTPHIEIVGFETVRRAEGFA
jgi:CubicO group peptidase (beta-lactamase class C family)